MNTRKRPVTQVVRTTHRWISLGFMAIVVALVVDALRNETTSELLSLLALGAIVLLLLSGSWLVVHHHSRGWRARRRRAVLSGPPPAEMGAE